MSIDGRGPSLNRAADNTIAALKSKNGRMEERIAVLEGIAQANADDRDSYMERCAELEDERDRARRIAVELEQQLHIAETAIQSAYEEAQDDMRVLDRMMSDRQPIDSYRLARVQVEQACIDRIRNAFLDRSDPDFGRAA